MRSTTSIRTQLVVLVLAVTVPLTAMGAYVVWSEMTLSRELADRTVLGYAQTTAEGVGQFIADSEQTLRGMAARPTIRALQVESCSSFLSEANLVLTQYRNFFVVRRDGSLVCSALDPPPGRESGADAIWYAHAVTTDGFSIAPPQYGRISRTWITVLSHPILGDDGTVQGYLGASVATSRFRDLLLEGLPQRGGIVTLAHQDRTVIARSDGADWTGRRLPRVEGGASHAELGRGIQRAVGLDGVDRVWGFHAVPGTDWMVYAGIPRTAVYARTRADAIGTGIGVVLLVGLLTLLAGGLYRRTSGSLDRLVDGVEAAARGGVPSISTDGPAEVVKVAQAFNRTLAARSRAQARLRRSTERYQSILRHAVFGIYVSTREGRIVEANPALAEMLGYDDPDELLAVPMEHFYNDPSERERLVERALGGRGSNVVEVEWVRKDGSPLQARLYVSIITDLDGDVAFEVMVEDLTERRDLEEQLRQAQKLEAVGRLAGGVAHDFNNRLTVIQGQAGILMADLPDEDPLIENVEAILESAMKASALTAQLLAFGRKQVARPRLLDLNEVVSHLGKVLPRLVGEDIVVRFELSPRPIRVMADPGQVDQILLNLCTNARDAMPRGGSLTIATAERLRADEERISASFGAGPWAVLTIADDGEGMSEAVRSRLFEPFFTTKDEGKGTGLGLSTVYGLVKQAGGDVEVVSRPGEGAAFHIWLPIASSSTPTGGADSAGVEAPHGRRALVVEGDPATRGLVVGTLTRAGWDVMEAGHGHAALEIAEGTRPRLDLVVADEIMPGMDGAELVSRMSAHHPGVRMLFLGGRAETTPDDEADTRLAFLAKPFSPAELIEAVADLTEPTAAPS